MMKFLHDLLILIIRYDDDDLENYLINVNELHDSVYLTSRPSTESPPPPPISNYLQYDSNTIDILYQNLHDDHPPPPVKNVTSKKVIQTLIPIEFQKVKNYTGEDKDTTCPITQMKFKKKSKVIQLPCSHCFFPKGILKWLTEENCYCPVCRYEFESTENYNYTD